MMSIPPNNPHLHLRAFLQPGAPAGSQRFIFVDGEKQWKCVNCGREGSLKHIQAEACSHLQPPCKSCGQTPYCAPDCSGMLDILGSDDVYVAGWTPEKGSEIN